MGLEHGEGSRGTHTFEKIIRSFLAFLRHKRKYYCAHTITVWISKALFLVAGAPQELLDAGKTLVAFIEAIKKEYDVCTQTQTQTLSSLSPSLSLSPPPLTRSHSLSPSPSLPFSPSPPPPSPLLSLSLSLSLLPLSLGSSQSVAESLPESGSVR